MIELCAHLSLSLYIYIYMFLYTYTVIHLSLCIYIYIYIYIYMRMCMCIHIYIYIYMIHAYIHIFLLSRARAPFPSWARPRRASGAAVSLGSTVSLRQRMRERRLAPDLSRCQRLLIESAHDLLLQHRPSGETPPRGEGLDQAQGPSQPLILPAEVRCYIACLRCLSRNA